MLRPSPMNGRWADPCRVSGSNGGDQTTRMRYAHECGHEAVDKVSRRAHLQSCSLGYLSERAFVAPLLVSQVAEEWQAAEHHGLQKRRYRHVCKRHSNPTRLVPLLLDTMAARHVAMSGRHKPEQTAI